MHININAVRMDNILFASVSEKEIESIISVFIPRIIPIRYDVFDIGKNKHCGFLDIHFNIDASQGFRFTDWRKKEDSNEYEACIYDSPIISIFGDNIPENPAEIIAGVMKKAKELHDDKPSRMKWQPIPNPFQRISDDRLKKLKAECLPKA